MSIGAKEIKSFTDNIAAPVTKALAAVYFSEPVGTGAGALVKYVGAKVGDTWEERELLRRLEGLADKVVRSLIPLFESSEEAKKAIEPITFQLSFALGHIADNFYLVRKNLDSVAVISDVKKKYPLPTSQYSDLETQLYERGLERAVRCLIELAPLLPKFSSESVGRQLQLLGTLDAKADALIDSIRRLEEMLSQSLGKNIDSISEAQRFELEYRLALSRQLDYLELFGADIAPEAQQHELSIAYITLSLAIPASQNKIQYTSFGQLLSQTSIGQKRLLIRGEAGGGKSTLSRWAALTAARAPAKPSRSRSYDPIYIDTKDSPSGRHDFDRVGSESGARSVSASSKFPSTQDEGVLEVIVAFDDWQDRVPFLIRMRDCQKGLPAIEDLVRHCSQSSGKPPQDWVKKVLVAGRALILLDGIDEVPNMNRSKILRQITTLVDTFPENLYVVTTRPAAVPAGWLAAAGFAEAAVNPLNESDKIELINRWHRAVERQRILTGKTPDLRHECEKLQHEIRDNLALGRLATNPLLCAMICALHHSRGAVVPQSAAELCEALCHMLLERREAEAGIDLSMFPASYLGLGYPQRKALVRDLAHYMVRNEASSVDVAEADEEIRKTYMHFPRAAPIDASVLRMVLVERTGVLREPQPGKVDFIHNTIKEYLAAEQFVDEHDYGMLASRGLDAGWQPVLAFAASSASKAAADKLIRGLLDRAKRAQGDERGRKLSILAIQCAATAVRISPELKTEVDLIAQTLFPPKNLAEAEQLAFGGDAVVSQLQYRKKMPVRLATACVRALRLINTSRARQEIEAYLQDKRWTVVGEAIQDINPLRANLIRETIKGNNKAYLPYDYRRRIDDLDPLRGEKDTSYLDLSFVSAQTLDPISDFQRLKYLDVQHSLYIENWDAIETLTSLESLTVSGTTFPGTSVVRFPESLLDFDANFTPLDSIDAVFHCKNLARLAVSNTQIKSLEGLQRLQNLRDLEVGASSIQSIAEVSKLPNLVRFVLRESEVEDISALANQRELTTLQLEIPESVDISVILQLTHLNMLMLSTPRAADILELGYWQKLTTLNVDAARLKSLHGVVRHRQLKNLALRGYVGQGSDLGALVELKSLHSLSLENAKLESLSGIEEIDTLQMLDLRGAEIVQPEALAQAASLVSVLLNRNQPRLIEYCKALPNVHTGIY